jgi:Histidine kinase
MITPPLTPLGPDCAAQRADASRADLWIVVVLTLLTFALASAFELYERFTAWTRPLELWQIDEVPVAFISLAAGMAWYGLRRAAEARRELHLRIGAQQQALNLLNHNRELAQQLLGVQESERRSLARELHDELGQHCHAIRVEAAFLQRCDDTQQAQAAVVRTAGHFDRPNWMNSGWWPRCRPCAKAGRNVPAWHASFGTPVHSTAWGRTSTRRCTAWRRKR